MKMKQNVAIFDIDGTIFRSSLLIEITDALVSEGVWPKEIRQSYARSHKKWLDRNGSYEDYIGGVIRAFNRNIAGVRQEKFMGIAKGVVAEQKNRTYTYTRDLVGELRVKDYYLLAISHSPKMIVEPFCRSLGFHKVYGQMFELDARGRYTGKVMFRELITDKSVIFRRALEKENLTLRGSVGVGDTEADIPVLKMVDRPICFNPNNKLYQTAKRNHWSVVVERKDVIYRL